MKNKIKHRCTRRVELDKKRVIIGSEAIKSLDLNKLDNEVVITTYDNCIIITKANK